MHPYAALLKTLFEQNANPTQAAPMKKYMRDQFEYLGIKTPQNIALQKAFFEENGFPRLSELDAVLRDLWQSVCLADSTNKSLPNLSKLSNMCLSQNPGGIPSTASRAGLSVSIFRGFRMCGGNI
jgi:DNA alkylation repair enzyme